MVATKFLVFTRDMVGSHTEIKLENNMKILSTECTKEEQQKDMPELLRLNAEACETEMMWEFFGGTITLPNGNRYQVADY